ARRTPSRSFAASAHEGGAQGSVRARRGRAGKVAQSSGARGDAGDGERAFLVGVEFRSTQFQDRRSAARSAATAQARMAAQSARGDYDNAVETGIGPSADEAAMPGIVSRAHTARVPGERLSGERDAASRVSTETVGV